MPEAAVEVESLVELLGAVADALDPGAMVTAYPHADPAAGAGDRAGRDGRRCHRSAPWSSSACVG
jgi:hypothetical protein